MLLSFTIQGQNYHRLLTESKYWDVSGAAMGYICSGFSDFPPKRQSFSGDTTFNGIVYAKGYYQIMYPEHFTPPPNCPPFKVDTTRNTMEWYFLREDTLSKKVWLYNSYDNIEELLYDFSLEQGDTLYYGIISSTVIDTVYEITTDDGITRKKFEISHGNMTGYYIEGIGGVAGLYCQPFYYFESGSWLMCVKDTSNNVIFSEYGFCYDFLTSVNSTNYNEKIKIYPNPCKEIINIYGIDFKTELFLFNNLGQLIKSEELHSNKKIDISNLNKGIYFAKFELPDKTIFHKLILKQ